MKKLFPILFLAGATLITACYEEEFDQPPTDGVDPGLTATTTIKELKAMHSFDQFETIQEDLIIKGIVVADDASGNWYRTFVLQDETGGIEVLTNLADSYVFYPVGREIYIKLKGLVLGDYNDLVQLGGFVSEDQSLGPIIDVTGYIVKGVKKGAPEPKVKKITELTADDISTLIKLENVQFVAPDTSRTFADPVTRTAYNRYLEDCAQNSVIVRTSGYANFAGVNVPNGAGNFIGILSVYRNDFQFFIRDLTDLDLDGSRCAFDPCAGTTIVEVASLDENFSSGMDNQDLALNGWTNVATKGTRLWRFREFGGNFYAQATAFGDNNNPDMETWLITPGIKLDVPKVFSFETAQAYWTHNALSVWISTNYVCDPTIATWQPLSATLAGQSNTNYQFIPSGEIDLSGYTGAVFIGFKYVGKGPSGQTVTYQVDNVVVKNK